MAIRIAATGQILCQERPRSQAKATADWVHSTAEAVTRLVKE